jgi:hypothetical protein
MSDLAPFVAAVLKDRVVAEMKQEVDHLSEQLQKSRAVQIISASGTVYAEGQFQDGFYLYNATVWAVELTKQPASCPLSDLTNARICIGGIFNADFAANSIVRAMVERDEVNRYMDGWGCIDFRVEGAVLVWLGVRVGPFPSEEAFFSQVPADIDLVNMASFLAEELAVNQPELSVIFDHVCFRISDVKGAIQDLNLDPAIEEEARRERAAAAVENGVEDDTGV